MLARIFIIAQTMKTQQLINGQTHSESTYYLKKCYTDSQNYGSINYVITSYLHGLLVVFLVLLCNKDRFTMNHACNGNT